MVTCAIESSGEHGTDPAGADDADLKPRRTKRRRQQTHYFVPVLVVGYRTR
jgi:hypothetical protein